MPVRTVRWKICRRQPKGSFWEILTIDTEVFETRGYQRDSVGSTMKFHLAVDHSAQEESLARHEGR